MDTVNNNPNRCGRFTSSEIVALLAEPTAAAIKKGEIFGQKAITYIQETRWERLSELPLDSDTDARELSWGKLGELFVSENVLGTEYEALMDVVYVNPKIDYHAGSPDFIKHLEYKVTSELKCPKTRKSYFQFYDCETIDDVRKNHPSGEKFYWQTVSNCILTGTNHGELMFFMPYKSQLDQIRTMARHTGEHKYQWIEYADDNSLPYIKDGGRYKNTKSIQWEISQADKDHLTTRILQAGKILMT